MTKFFLVDPYKLNRGKGTFDEFGLAYDDTRPKVCT